MAAGDSKNKTSLIEGLKKRCSNNELSCDQANFSALSLTICLKRGIRAPRKENKKREKWPNRSFLASAIRGSLAFTSHSRSFAEPVNAVLPGSILPKFFFYKLLNQTRKNLKLLLWMNLNQGFESDYRTFNFLFIHCLLRCCELVYQAPQIKC